MKFQVGDIVEIKGGSDAGERGEVIDTHQILGNYPQSWVSVKTSHLLTLQLHSDNLILIQRLNFNAVQEWLEQ